MGDDEVDSSNYVSRETKRAIYQIILATPCRSRTTRPFHMKSAHVQVALLRSRMHSSFGRGSFTSHFEIMDGRATAVATAVACHPKPLPFG